MLNSDDDSERSPEPGVGDPIEPHEPAFAVTTPEAAVNEFLAQHHVQDGDIRQLISATTQALTLIDVRLRQAGLNDHARRNFWHLLTLLQYRKPSV